MVDNQHTLFVYNYTYDYLNHKQYALEMGTGNLTFQKTR